MLFDTTDEIEEMQHNLWMRRTPQERARFTSAMFAVARDAIIASLPKDLPTREFKRRLYERAYGEPLARRFSVSGR